MDLTSALVELYRQAATDLPKDIENALLDARKKETGNELSTNAFNSIIENIKIAREQSVPLCQDTGTPVFYVKVPAGLPLNGIEKEIINATKIATEKIPLRSNSVDSYSGRNTGDNIGVHFPVIYREEWDKDYFSFDLLLKGGGSENACRTYNLPDARINAGRDLDGIRKCIIDTVFSAQGIGCPPGIITVCVGGLKDVVSFNSKKLLLKKLSEKHPIGEIADFEEKLCEELNTLGTGVAGLGGRTTVLGVKMSFVHRPPASFIVDVSYCCWVCRRKKLVFRDGEANYE